MVVRTAHDLGLLIRSRRKEVGLDQQGLARLVGVSRLWINEFERGKPRAEIGLVLRTLTALGLRLDVAAEEVTREPSTRSLVEAPDIDAVVRRARKPR